MSERCIVGVDIGTSAIKVLAAKKQNDGTIEVIGSGFVPSLGIDKGRISDIQALTQSMMQAVDCAIMAIPHNTVSEAYVGVGGEVLSYSVSMGSVAPVDSSMTKQQDVQRVCQAASLAVGRSDAAIIHVIPQEFYIDHQKVTDPLNKCCECLEVKAHVLSLSNYTYSAFEEAFQDKGIELVNIVSNAVVTEKAQVDSSEMNYYYMDIGAGTVDVLARVDGQVHLVASFPFGGDYITSDIMQGLSVERNHAEGIKRYYSKLQSELYGQNVVLDCNDYGTTDKHIPFDFLSRIIESRVEEIIHLLREHLLGINTNLKAESIFLTGGCSSLPSIKKEMEKVFGIPVKITEVSGLPFEYAYAENAACYGIIRHAFQNVQEKSIQQSPNSTWSSVLKTIKKVFGN